VRFKFWVWWRLTQPIAWFGIEILVWRNVRLNAHTQVLIAKHSHMTKRGKEELRQEPPLVRMSSSARRYNTSLSWIEAQFAELESSWNQLYACVMFACVFLSVLVCAPGCKQRSVKPRLRPWQWASTPRKIFFLSSLLAPWERWGTGRTLPATWSI